MFSTDDTIVAIATPSGRGGIGVVRISGPAASDIARALLTLEHPLAPRHATFARVRHDQVIVTCFPAPHSYTGEHVVEISAHGSPVVLRQIVEDAMNAGARPAEAGEFTLRAFLNGRIDLVQAEAVADLIDAATPVQARAAFDQLEGTLTGRLAAIDADLFDLIARLEASLDFPDEGYHFVDAREAGEALGSIDARIAALLMDARRGRLLREGARVAIAGKPNVGKSSLFNALLQTGRAIVTPMPGTTRDLVTERADIEGLQLELVDTAGIREAHDEVESEGVARARRAWASADAVVVVLDGSALIDEADREILRETESMARAIVCNKRDLEPAWPIAELGLPTCVVEVSCVTGAGLDGVRAELRRVLGSANPDTAREPVAITNARHIALLERARAALARAIDAVHAAGGPVPEEFVLTDLADARAAFEEVTGKRTPDDVLRHIFSRFCIGK